MKMTLESQDYIQAVQTTFHEKCKKTVKILRDRLLSPGAGLAVRLGCFLLKLPN